MTIILLDETTAGELQDRAVASGMSVDDYVKSLLKEAATAAPPRPSWEEVEAMLDELSHDGPTLPADLAPDIYCDHD